ncbi:MAG: plastocyanin [Chloroflexi bacterium RBG_16_56_11]|nr:MAG: plastocyanin [Chloroflexi bacterium RBG_16_56_11]
MQGQAFRPATLTVTAGTMVTWRNNDGVTHTVTADDGSFDSGSLSGGDNFSHTFAVKGTFTYHCGFHPTMTGKVIVQ